MKNIHIALDFDKTLAYYESSWRAKKVGEPLQKMVDNVKRWLSKGYKVSIFTARVSQIYDPSEGYLDQIDRQIKDIKSFLFKVGLPENLEITAVKRKSFTHFIDDKAFGVVPNFGDIINIPEELK